MSFEHLRTMKISCLIVIAIYCALSDALYEDQVGKWDWRQRYVGKIKHITSFHLSSSQSVVVATDRNVLASIFVRNGSLNWRQLLESRTSDPTANVINAIGNGVDEYNGLAEVAAPLSLITISGNGRYVRNWEPTYGVLEWEKPLPDEILKDVNDGTSKLVFDINQQAKQITLAKFNNQSKNVEINILDVKSGQTKKSPSIATGSWFNDVNSCTFITSRYLACVDEQNLNLHFLIVGESKTFASLSLQNFGLKTVSQPRSLKLLTYGNQQTAVEPIFAIDLGGDGIVVLRIQAKQVKLLKVLPNAKAISVAPINLPDSTVAAKFGVFVLITKPDELKRRDNEDSTVQPFRVAAFDVNSWDELRELNGQFELSSHTPVRVDNFVILPFLKPNAEMQYKILLTTEEQSVVLVSPQGKITWVREEALSSIVSTKMIDLPLSELDASIEQAFGFSSNVVSQFMARITSQVHQFQTEFTYYVNKMAELIAPTSPARHLSQNNEDNDAGFDPTNKLDSSTLVRDYFGLHKIILVLTAPGKVFGIDNLTGKILWSFYDARLGEQLHSNSRKIPIYVQRSTAHFPFEPIATIVVKSGLVISFNPVTGAVKEKIETSRKLKQALLMSHVDDTFTKGILMLDEQNQASVYPSSASDVFLANKRSYFLMVGNEVSGLLQGYSFAKATKGNPTATVAWSISVPLSDSVEANRIDIVFKRSNEQVHSQGRVLGDRNVLYKYLNPNLVVVAMEGADAALSPEGPTKVKPHYINIYLLDAVSGAIVYTTTHKRCRGPVHLAHTENSIIYSYYNDKARRTEISSIELYEGAAQTNGTAFSSVERPYLQPPVIHHQTFIFPTGMIAMVDTQTEKGITNKHLLIALPSGGLLELPKAFLDPRRPINPTMEHREEGLIPYVPELPIPSEGIINYNKSLMQIKAIDVAPSGLESTSLVFAHGLDIFYTRVTPSKTFDILKDDFDHLLIAAVLVILVGLGYVSKWLAARKTLKNAWK